MQKRSTNVSAESLARSKPVRRFMARILEEHRNPETGEVFTATLAVAVANAFKLYEEDGFTIPDALVEVAQEVAREDARKRL